MPQSDSPSSRSRWRDIDPADIRLPATQPLDVSALIVAALASQEANPERCGSAAGGG